MAPARQISIPFFFLPTENCVVNDDQSTVNFINFAVGKATLLEEHKNFISNFVVKHYMKQVEALQDKNLTVGTVHTFGTASATGTAAHDDALSVARAQAVGNFIAASFDQQKGTGAFSKSVHFEVDAKGGGETRAKKIRDAAEQAFHHKISDQTVEKSQGAFRAAGAGLNINAAVTPEDNFYQCRELYQASLKRETIPSNLLEQKIAEIEKDLDQPGLTNIAIKFVLKTVIGQIKKLVNSLISTLLEELPGAGKILSFAIDFIKVNDVANLFEFKDHRDIHAVYEYDGDSHKKELVSFLSILTTIAGLRQYLVKAETQLRKLQALPQAAPFRPKIQAAIQAVVDLREDFDRELDTLTAKGGAIRTVLGDTLTDEAIRIIKSDSTSDKLVVPISDFSEPFAFNPPRFVDVNSFSGPARTQSVDVALKSTVTLDFSGLGPEGLLGFQGKTTMVTNLSTRNSLLGASVTNGRLFRFAGQGLSTRAAAT